MLKCTQKHTLMTTEHPPPSEPPNVSFATPAQKESFTKKAGSLQEKKEKVEKPFPKGSQRLPKGKIGGTQGSPVPGSLLDLRCQRGLTRAHVHDLHLPAVTGHTSHKR